jgi:HlyD family secretion protein
VGGATGGTSTASGPLAQIADLSTISVDVEVNEIDVSDVKVGQQAQVTFTAIPGLELQGTVKSVASVASNANAGSTGTATGAGTGVVTFKATTVIDQPDNRLRPGMSSNVKIVTKVLENVLLVPSAAVTEEGETAYVNVPTGQDGLQTERREVVVAGRTTSQVAIESGLQEGERVVVSNPIASLASSNSGA